MESVSMTISRRRFHRLAAAAVSACGLPIRPVAFAQSKSHPPGRYVDVHTHIGRVWNSQLEMTAAGLLKWMDQHEVAQAVVLPLASPESSSFLLTSEWVLQETRPHRDRLIPFCSIDPRTSYTGGARGLLSILRAHVDHGAKGFGEHKNGLPIDDPKNMLIYQACSELKIPLLFHLDNIRNTDKPGLPGLENCLKQFPTLPFIGHGPGWWASISAAVPDHLGAALKGPVVPGGAIDRLMDLHPNLYGDLSAGSGAGALSRDMTFARDFVLRRQDRLMFGTDYLYPGQVTPQFDILDQLRLPAEVQAKVFRDNARRVIRI
jgi:hypothetical protein